MAKKLARAVKKALALRTRGCGNYLWYIYHQL